MTDLLPCPFCGGSATIIDGKMVKGHGCYVECTDCHVSIFRCPDAPADSRSAAIAAWNTRATGWQPIATAPREE